MALKHKKLNKNNKKSLLWGKGSILLLLFGCVFWLVSPETAQAQQITQTKQGWWHGFRQTSFLFDSIPAYYVVPAKPLPGNPWIWRGHFPDWHTDMDSLLLQKGFYVAYINTNDEYGAPKAMMVWDKFYQYLTGQLSFAPKVALEGVSRGGLYVYGWAERNPDKVSCIYAEAPVCDIKSWPGGKGRSLGDGRSWQQLQQVLGFTERQAMDYRGNPIDNLKGLASFKVPVLHVIGLNDKVVPPDENTFVLIKKYEELGGPATVYPMTRGPQELNGHHFAIEHPDQWADFIYKHSFPVNKPLLYEDYFQVRNGLSNALGKFETQKTGTVAFLGGSITFNPGWRNMVMQYLQERFPETKFHFIAAGIPSLGSLPHAFRLQRDVLDSGKVDLMFIEAAVNDRVNGTDSLTQVRDLEGIVRHARNSNPEMDIVMMSFADPDKLKDYGRGIEPVEIKNHELVAAHYHLPSINLAKEVYDKIKAGEFSWEYDFKDLHPAAYGQELYFQSIKSLLGHCMDLVMDNRSSPIEKHYKLPDPLGVNFDHGEYFPIENAHSNNGWHIINDWKPADNTHTREGFVNCPMLVATEPGASLSLSFNGTAVGMAIVSGPDAGIISYQIDHGAKHTVDLYTEWSNSLYLPWYILFDGALKKGKHTLTLTLTGDKNQKNKGTACYIEYFLVNR